jgi:hypothetical protein
MADTNGHIQLRYGIGDLYWKADVNHVLVCDMNVCLLSYDSFKAVFQSVLNYRETIMRVLLTMRAI